MIILMFLKPSIHKIKELLSKLGELSKYFIIAFKALGISYITGFVSDTCKDFGHSALAAKAELAGKCTIFVLSFPLLSGIMETVINYANI
jgi:stage III sporulation protein AD